LVCDAAALSNFYINAGDAGRLVPKVMISAIGEPGWCQLAATGVMKDEFNGE
jgi:hypothetical protein